MKQQYLNSFPRHKALGIPPKPIPSGDETHALVPKVPAQPSTSIQCGFNPRKEIEKNNRKKETRTAISER
jgi:hypothetical protein